jgi:hypothetical protein
LTRADPLARGVFALLVIACFAAFFVTQRLKHTPTVIQRFQLTPRFSPTPGGHVKQEGISFRLAKADAVTVTIIDANEDVVATLVRNHRLPGYKQFSLRWNGRRGTAHRFRSVTTAAGHTVLLPINVGGLAPPGEYRVKVTLRAQDRKVLSPRGFMLLVAG